MANRHPTRRAVLSGSVAVLGMAAASRGGVAREASADAGRLGPAFAPDYALPLYDSSGKGIPEDALDQSDFPSLAAWFDAMEESGRPGKIASGTYDASSAGRRRLRSSLYGYGKTRPVLSSSSPFILYLSADDLTVQYLRFETPSLAIAYVDRGEKLLVRADWGSADLEGHEREGSRALEHDADIKGIRIADCAFGCPLPIAFMSQYHHVRDIHVARNRALPGCAGFATVRSDRFNNIHVYQNDIAGLDQKTLRGNHVGTIIWVGSTVNNSPQFPANKGVFVENNRIEDVTASGVHRDYNSAVAIDIREASQALIRNNVIRNVINTAGHVDCNAIYAKSGVTIEDNVIENCGADASGSNVDGAGSEGSLVTLKGGSRCVSIIRGNTLIAGSLTDVPMIMSSHNTIIEGNAFHDWRYSGDNMYRDAMIRTYSGGPVTVINPTFINCGTAPGNAHAGYAIGKNRGGSIIARDFTVEFDGARTDIFQGDVAIENCINHSGSPLTVGYNPSTQSVVDAVEVLLQQKQKVAMDLLVRALKQEGVWPRLRVLCIMHARDSQMADVDWIVPRRALAPVGMPTFVPLSGYRATAPGQKLDTTFSPVKDALPVNDCMIAAAIEGPDVAAGSYACGNTKLSLIVRDRLDGHEACLASETPVRFAEPVRSAAGFHAVQRVDGTTVQHYHEGRLLGSAMSQSSSHADAPLTILAREDMTDTAPYTIWAFAAGLALSAPQHMALTNALLQYRASAGKPRGA